MTGLTILIGIYIIFRLGKHALRQGRMIEEQKELIKNMTKWEDKYKAKNDFDADMEAQDSKWGKHKI